MLARNVIYRIFMNFSAFFLGFIFWGLCSSMLIIYTTSPFLYSEIEDIPACEYALVLGAAKQGKYGLNPYFKYRMEAAAELYFSGKVKKIIVSGDNHIQSYDETTDMAEYLISLGVPDSAIIRDYAGFRTLDSVVRAKKVFHCTSLIIVSQEFHNQRAVFIARCYGIDAIGYNARDLQKKNNLTHWRELAAKLAAIIDVFILNRQPKFL